MARGLGAAVAAAAVGLGVTINHIEASDRLEARVHVLTGGSAKAGRAAIGRHGCGGCHVIPGVPGARGKVGPPLTGFAGRSYIAGRRANTPENLTDWIVDPHRTDPQTAMPVTGVNDREARDIAAYLSTLG
jgi:cytochrome c2